MYRQVFIKLIIILTIVSALLGCETVEQTQRGDYSATTYNLNHTSNQRNISAGQRVALIIGNANYAKKDELLINPLNDADDIAKVLPNFGFKVLLYKDVDNKAMREAIAEFGRQSSNAEAALFFYAGHGVQSNNRNFLIPVTANILNEASLEYETVNLNFVLDTLDQAGSKANLVFLDACRNNPYSGVFRSSRGGAMRGLAPPSGVPSGTMIVYATDPGKSASDGEGRNGLLTAGMLEALQGRDLSLGGVLAIASKKVVALSNNEQIPYVNGPETLRTDFYFRAPQLAANAPPVTVPIMTPTVTPPLPKNDRLTELQQQRIAEEARVADLTKQRQEVEEKLRLEEARKKREEEARVADLERQRQRKELEEANRLAEARRQREAEEARLAELTSQRKEAQQLISDRYQDNGDGTVTDVTTNLMWKRCSEGQTWTGSTCAGETSEISWRDAMPNGQQKSWASFAGRSDWRMPSRDELRSLVDCSSGKMCIDQIAFPNTPATWFWSDSPNADGTEYAWIVSFYYGYDSGYGSRTITHRVRLVCAGTAR